MTHWWCALASAAEPELTADLRVIGTLPPDVAVDAEGTTSGETPRLEGRMRVRLHGASPTLEGDVEVDMLEGQWAGEPWALGGVDERNLDGFDATDDMVEVRKLWIAGRTSAGQLGVGITTSHWGLGMVANDGATESPFGHADWGDRVLRARFATQPVDGSPLVLLTAMDAVLRDDTARLRDGQLATQAVFAAIRRAPRSWTAGVYAVARHQREADPNRSTTAVVLDGTAAAPLAVAGWTLNGAVELATVSGRTDRVVSYGGTDGVAISSAGLLTELSAGPTDGPVDLLLRGAWASGDGNPDDGVTHDFTFDRDANLGMVLFDEVAAAVEARAVALVSDPARSAAPPDGVELLATEGAFRRALAVQPVLRWRPTDTVAVAVGALAAWSTAPIAHPFYSYRAGGVPTDLLDRASNDRSLGQEVDASVAWTPAPLDALEPSLRLQFGHAWLGAGLGGPGTATLGLAEGHLRF